MLIVCSFLCVGRSQTNLNRNCCETLGFFLVHVPILECRFRIVSILSDIEINCESVAGQIDTKTFDQVPGVFSVGF